MLNPGERSQLFSLLKPLPDYTLDFAVGTTYPLDLFALLSLPLSFASMDWETRDGEVVSNPLLLMEAIRRNAEKMDIFCQAGGIKPPDKHQPLFAYLEKSIHEVHLEGTTGVFHPKTWVLRFSNGESVFYRFLSMSRNLTHDRSWDTVVSLEGYLADRQRGIERNYPLSEFVGSLSDLAISPLSNETRKRIALISEELRKVRFEVPEGFDEFRFWFNNPNIDREFPNPFPADMDQGLIISPFLSNKAFSAPDSVFSPFLNKSDLISRYEQLVAMDPAVLRKFKQVYFMAPDLEGQPDELSPSPDYNLEGLHAKIFVADGDQNSSVFSGSFNATDAAFRTNVEFMVELVGNKYACGVDRILNGDYDSSGIRPLLKEFDPATVALNAELPDQRLEKLLSEIERNLIFARFYGKVEEVTGAGYSVTMFAENDDHLNAAIEKAETILVRPFTLHEDRAKPLTMSCPIKLEKLSLEALTSFFVFHFSAVVDGVRKSKRVIRNLPLLNAPADRLDKVLASVIQDWGKLIQLILLLLSRDGGGGLTPELQRILNEEGNPTGLALKSGLLERLLITLANDAKQFKQVAELIKKLRNTEEGASLVPEKFLKIWQPISQIAEELL